MPTIGAIRWHLPAAKAKICSCINYGRQLGAVERAAQITRRRNEGEWGERKKTTVAICVYVLLRVRVRAANKRSLPAIVAEIKF